MVLDQLFILNSWVAYGLAAAIVLAAAEFGRLIGMSWRRRHPEAMSADISTLVGGALGLLALMIGFTYSLTLSRFDARLDAVVNEANAIGTTDLRASMLPEPHASEVKKLLRDYVQMRIDLSLYPQSQSALEQARHRSNELQAALWQHAVAISAADPLSIRAGLFVQTLNEMIDLQETRLAAVRHRVPAPIFLLLHAIAVVAIGFSGYLGGLGGGIGRIPVAITAVMVASVIGMVGDIDRSQSGFITVDQQPMYNLRESMDR
jgi:hypothetical protein